LQTQNWVLVLAGCIASAGLALVADALLGLIEKGLATRRRMLTFGGLAAVLLGILAALTLQFGDRGGDRIVIGAKGFSEQYILARLIGQQLKSAGYGVEYRDGLGSAVAHQAVSTGAIDVLVDYTGTIWTNQMERSDNPDRETMLAEIAAWETRTSGTHVLGRLGFENAYGLAMPRAAAEACGFTSIGDLAGRAQAMTIGGDPEFFERPEWIAVREAYGLRFAARRNFSPTFMYNALTSGESDVIGAYTSDGRIAADDLVILDDPEGAFPNYDAIILLAPQTGTDDALVAALEPLIGAIGVEAMREANYSVDRTEDKLSFERAAQRLAERIGQ
ncbi:MAG TPA: ABC transporter permease, partial [Erythrobacter sp.]|nr:ABC transporter permease [Erythrobacter sp.]